MVTKNTNPYHTFSTPVFRSPYFPLNLLLEWLAELDRSSDYLKTIVVRPDIQEAIFLASPVLYEETSKYLADHLKSKEKEKYFFSVLKYLSRMASRCTPFGLFAGCSVGEIVDSTDITLPEPEHYSRHTRLDMNYLCALTQDIAKREELRYRLLYFPNNSGYVVGDKLRYVEYHYLNGNRRHNIVVVDHTEYLSRLLTAAKEGVTVEQLASILVDDEISRSEAIEYIDELINSQVLVSELEPSVTGPELLDQLICTMAKFDDQQIIVTQLKSLSELLQEVDSSPIGTSIPLYIQIKEKIKVLGTTFSEKHLFQSDMLKPCKHTKIDKTISEELLQAITFLNIISQPSPQDTLLDRFASSFHDRYEEREVPLAQFLDTEMGLDLRQSGSSGDMTPLLDGIPFGLRQQENISHGWNWLQSLLHLKITEALVAKEQEIIFSDDDVKNASPLWSDLPHTIAVMCEILSFAPDGKMSVFLHSIGGSGAANLLGRFCHVDEGINKTVVDIISEEEKELGVDKVYAEIVHLPESRIGNILARPVLRQYEIPYLAKSGVEKEFQLEISDLMVSVRQKKFVLRSKKLNKEVIPRLTSAHNYSYAGVMPIYQFLCNLQHQHKRGGIGLFLSSLFNEYSYLPRISYKNFILSLARWIIKPDELKKIVEQKEMAETVDALRQWKKSTGIPRFVVLPDGDNELFTDTESLTSIRMLYSVVKKRTQFTLKEFPFDMENAILKNGSDVYTNEWLFTFYKKKQP
ncbi:MAG: lantibiotic dehydratase family protein [Prevotellaceae bacterium]|jgi:hypothetical protein|nr:lantibiotic dehydratase family protein [Prevotellaceae bacterium]